MIRPPSHVAIYDPELTRSSELVVLCVAIYDESINTRFWPAGIMWGTIFRFWTRSSIACGSVEHTSWPAGKKRKHIKN